MKDPTVQSNQVEQLAAIEAFERETGYDATYMKEMLKYAPAALSIFNHFIPMASHREHAPLLQYYVAKLTAYRHCDCGPCFQLALDMAKHEEVPVSIRKAIAFEKGTLPPDLQRVRSFTLAVLRNDPSYEEHRRALESEIGKGRRD